MAMLRTMPEWINDIPENWEVIPLKRYFSFGKGLPITKADLVEKGEKVVSYGQIHAKYNSGVHIDQRLVRYVSSSYLESNPLSLCTKGDVIMADTSEDREGCGNAVYVDTDEAIFAGYHTIILKSDKNNKYLAYLFLSDAWRYQIRKRVQGVKLFSITQKILNQCSIIVPPVIEQYAITSYLDDRCSRLDEIITEAEKSIEEYKELKQAVIFEAVTKGLDKNVPMKDSGVEWIGKTPDNWTVLSLRFLCEMQAGKNLVSEEIAESGDYPVYGGNGLRGYYSEFNTEGPHLLVGRQGALCGNIHSVDGQYWCTEHAVVTTPSSLVTLDYLYFLLVAMDLNQYASNTAAQPGLSVNKIIHVKTVIPGLREQRDIVEYLENKIPSIDALISEKQSLIEDLKAYKKSLIYEVVTGKRRIS